MTEKNEKVFKEPDDIEEYLYRESLSLLKTLRQSSGSSVEPYITGAGKFLDLAAGTGVYSIFLAEKYPSSQFICMEPDPVSRKVAERISARNGVNLTIIGGTANKIPYEDNTFDYIIIRKALQYFTPVDRCFSELHRVLKNGGVCFIIKHINFPAYPLFHLLRFGDFDFFTKKGSYKYLKIWISSGKAARLLRRASFSDVEIVPTDFMGRDISGLKKRFLKRVLAPYAVKPFIIARK